jgi:enoyl-CoA hydratase/carnithine racemase
MITPHGLVDSQHQDDVLVLRLNRPPAHAFTTELLADLDAAIRGAAEDRTVRSVVVTGSGPFFSAGFDMKAPPRGRVEALEMADLYHSAHRQLVALPKPTIAAVNGHAVAGGLVLALGCDHRVAPTFRFRVGLTEVAVGAGYPPAASAIAIDRLHAEAIELMLGADLMWSDDPRLSFLFRSTHEPAAFEAEALALARKLASLPAAAYAHTKAAVARDLLARIDGATDEERAAALAVWTDPESDAARDDVRRTLGS